MTPFFIIFNIVILSLVILDFMLLAKKSAIGRVVFLTFAWIFLGTSFSIVIYLRFGLDGFFEYLSAYFVEKSLSVDNIFVFLMIFDYFGIQREYQRKLLFIGIWSALFLRITTIFAVSELLSLFHFTIYIFGALMLYAGISSFFKRDGAHVESRLLKKVRNYIDVYAGDHRGRFFVKEDGKTKATILLLSIFCIEVCDIVFAFDSIPALFSITNNKTIIYTSNAFAIIGLRSLYLVFASAVDKIHYLKYGVGTVLCYIGLKMMLADYVHINSSISLMIISGILSISFILSEIRGYRQKRSR
ncbi:MAG: TerC/Alx family metal homeostasis membrane protein [Holosporaceae bacterium]|nr:TerC/Alx family metal homeostasis membrane protein [Holosporaceae bacterium]